MCWIHPSCNHISIALFSTQAATTGICHESCNYTDAEHAMKSTQANGRLSSIAASHSGHSELSSIADDQPAYQLTGNHQPAAAGSRIE